MSMDDQIRQAIILHPETSPSKVAKDLSVQFQQYIPTSVVMKVRGSLKQAENVLRAQEEASEKLADKLAIADEVTASLLDIFRDELRSTKERIEASKELRQYLKLSIDSAGIYDDATNTTFVIGADWGTGE